MLRRALIAASESRRLRHFSEQRAMARKVVDRFVPGDTLDEAIAAAHQLAAMGASVTLDHLGESVDDEAHARRGAEAYLVALDRLAAEGLDASISVKPTAIGLDVSPELCEQLLRQLCEKAAEHDMQVTVDMEDSDTTQFTVDTVAKLRSEGFRVGCAVQAYLKRTPADLRRLTELGSSLRICKGAYAEDDEIALQDRSAIRQQFLELAEHVLGSGVYGRFATHDDFLVAQIEALASRHQTEHWEFQMLYGVREPLQREVLAHGHKLRIYLPYGAEWYPYFVRRLAERPANLTFFLRALVGKR